MGLQLIESGAGNMSDWAAAFGCKVHIPIADKAFVTEPGDHIEHWSGERLIRFVHCSKQMSGGLKDPATSPEAVNSV